MKREIYFAYLSCRSLVIVENPLHRRTTISKQAKKVTNISMVAIVDCFCFNIEIETETLKKTKLGEIINLLEQKIKTVD